jgi:hypothetical protein
MTWTFFGFAYLMVGVAISLALVWARPYFAELDRAFVEADEAGISEGVLHLLIVLLWPYGLFAK